MYEILYSNLERDLVLEAQLLQSEDRLCALMLMNDN